MYVIVWEYVVPPAKVEDFVSAYGAGGAWAELFGLADGFEGVELYRQEDVPARFVTVDRWRTAGDFAAFKARFEPDYHRLDEDLADLTVEENRLGAFDQI